MILEQDGLTPIRYGVRPVAFSFESRIQPGQLMVSYLQSLGGEDGEMHSLAVQLDHIQQPSRMN